MRMTTSRALVASLAALPLLIGTAAALKKKDEPVKKGPIDEVGERYLKARTPNKEKGQSGPVVLSPGECKSFAKDFIRAGEKEKGHEAEGLYNAGVVYDQCGMLREAEDHYQRALAKNPKLQPAMNNLGVIYQKTNRQVQAQNQFEAAIRVDARNAQAVQAYNNKAALLYERARQSGGGPAAFQEAIGSLQRALAVDANSVQAYALLAQIYYQTAEQDPAKLKLAQLVIDEGKKINDEYPPLYNTMGLIKLRRKDVTGALNEFRRAVTLDSGFIEAQLNVAAISLSSRNYKQAEDAFQAVLKRQPNNVDAIIGMGVATRGQKRVKDAEKWYKQAQQIDPRGCAPLYNLAVLYHDYKTGQPEELRKAQDYYNNYTRCQGRTDPEKVADSRRRIKDIEDTFKAMEEQKRLEAELKKQQEEMQRQEKLMQEQMKQQQQGAPPAK
jgi:tetratricopeptide (TPR) repeat protein